MSRGGHRNYKEDELIDFIDRNRRGQIGPQGDPEDKGTKKRLHECQPGDWVKQVLPGTDNFGPLLRVLNPKAGLLENRAGVRSKVPPRTQVMVMT